MEPDFEMLENPARVMTAQKKVITLPAGCRYSSIKPVCDFYTPFLHATKLEMVVKLNDWTMQTVTPRLNK